MTETNKPNHGEMSVDRNEDALDAQRGRRRLRAMFLRSVAEALLEPLYRRIAALPVFLQRLLLCTFVGFTVGYLWSCGGLPLVLMFVVCTGLTATLLYAVTEEQPSNKQSDHLGD